MDSQSEIHESLRLADRATLRLLSALEDGESATQRSLAARIGVALGLTNSLLKRAVRKGLVKIGEAPAKRYAYYVTPKGFKEKGRLVADYLTSSLTFFRRARKEYADLFQQVERCGCKRVALLGTGELTEIAMLSAQEAGVDLHCVIELGSNIPTFSSLPIYSSLDLAKSENVDAIVIANKENPQAEYDRLTAQYDSKQIFTVPLLHISRRGNRGGA